MFDFSKNGVYDFTTDTGADVTVVVTTGPNPDVKTLYFSEAHPIKLDAYAHMVRSTGGACAMKLKEGEWENQILPIISSGDLPPPASGGFLVVITAAIAAVAGQAGAEAVFWHEIGHVVSGHCVTRPTSFAEYVKQEEEADTYASAKVGKAAVKTALIACVTNQLPGRGWEKGVSAFLETEEGAPLRLRLLALA